MKPDAQSDSVLLEHIHKCIERIREYTGGNAGQNPHRSNCVNSDKDTDRTSKDDSGKRSPTPSVVEPPTADRPLARLQEFDAVRDRAAAEKQAGNGPGPARGSYEEKQVFAEVKAVRPT